jgi:hypothetical protein
MRALATRRRIVKAGCLSALGGASWLVYDTSTEGGRAAALRDRIERTGGFHILTNRLQAQVGPSVILPGRPVALADLGPHRLRAYRSVAAALAPYPQGFLPRLLDTVALAGEVTFWGATTVGGFFFPRGICLNAGDPADAGATTTRLFHHELSSLVRAAARLEDSRWAALNPPGFRWLDEAGYRTLLQHHPHQAGDPTLWREGFVRPYGMSDPDDDFNTFAEAAFSDGPAFAALIGPFPRMRAKTALLIETYERLDPRLAGYFDRTGLGQASRPT